MCPPAPAPHSKALIERVDIGVRRMLSYMHPLVAWSMAVGFIVLDWLPIVTLQSTARLHRIKAERGSALLARWSRSRFKALRLLIQGARGVVLSVYYDQSEVHAAMHYAPAPFMRDRVQVRHKIMVEQEPISSRR
jgi:hypothetical protein